MASNEKEKQVIDWKPKQLGVLKELKNLEDKVNIKDVYLGKSRQVVAKTIKLK